MFFNKSFFSLTALFSIFVHVHCLERLRQNDNCDLATGETAIRDTLNNLFITLKIGNIGHKSRLKEFSTIHNYFISTTLSNCVNLKEMEMISRVNDIDNKTCLISEINEILNGKAESDALTDSNILTISKYVETFISKLRYLKDNYEINNKADNIEINSEIINYLNTKDVFENNTEENNNIKSENFDNKDNTEVWSQSGRRIYHGHSVRIEMYPFMASIHAFDEFRCGGCIIKSNAVMTSATCLESVSKHGTSEATLNALTVRVGSTYTDSGGQKIGVQAMYFNPYYKHETLAHNLGLLRLNRRISYSRKSKTIEFETYPNNIGGTIIVLGWGGKNRKNDKSSRLLYNMLDHYSTSVCKQIYGREYVTDHHFCAGVGKKVGGACNYDIGGPGIYKGKVSGIISFGGKCGEKNAPTVFTRVGHYSDWIRYILGQMSYTDSMNYYRKLRNLNYFPQNASIFGGTIKSVDETVTETTKESNYAKLFSGIKGFVSKMFVGRKNHEEINNYEWNTTRKV